MYLGSWVFGFCLGLKVIGVSGFNAQKFGAYGALGFGLRALGYRGVSAQGFLGTEDMGLGFQGLCLCRV